MITVMMTLTEALKDGVLYLTNYIYFFGYIVITIMVTLTETLKDGVLYLTIGSYLFLQNLL